MALQLLALLTRESPLRARDVAADLAARVPPGGPEADALLAELARIAGDRRVATGARVMALLATAQVAALRGSRLPDGALAALEDPRVVETALRLRLGAALTGALGLADPAALTPQLSRLLALRLVLAGERGPHVVKLILRAGTDEDLGLAGRIAAEDFCAAIATRSLRDADVVEWCRAAIGWVDARQGAFFARFAEELRRRDAAAPARLADWLARVGGPSPAIERARRSLAPQLRAVAA